MPPLAVPGSARMIHASAHALPLATARIAGALAACLLIALALAASPARAWVDLGKIPGEEPGRAWAPDGIHVLDGSYVMNIGELQINITNHGLIGSQYSNVSTFSSAPSGQWPAGSGDEYLWGAGLWVGAVMGGQRHVSTGQYERELRPLNYQADTIYEARKGEIRRPAGHSGVQGARYPLPGYDDDQDGRIDEEILNGYDDDGDGRIDEDFGQLGDQMMVCTMYDNTPLAGEIYPDHVPLGLKVVQSVFAWDAPEFRDLVGVDYTITNVGGAELQDVYVGMLVDCDIGPHERTDNAKNDMTGYFSGRVQASDGSWPLVNVAYMYDGPGPDRLTGYFGVMFVGASRTEASTIRAYRHFAGLEPFEYGGDPIDDEQRYAVLSSARRDPNSEPGEENDYRFVVSRGPWPLLQPGATISFDAAFVAGDGLEDLLIHCANAMVAWKGRFFDLDGRPDTGVRGRETLLCFGKYPGPGDPIWSKDADYMDASCTGRFPIYPITKDDFFTQPDGSVCIWVNMDNCDECDQLAHQRCTNDNRLFERYWDCMWDVPWYHSPQELIGCTGVFGAESRVSWMVERYPPPSPGVRVAPGNHQVRVFWNDDSEHVPDPQLGVVDFESYRVWRSDNWDRPVGTSVENGPGSGSWQLIAEYDLQNQYVNERTARDGTVLRDTLDLGMNTGLDVVAYRPVCLDDPRFGGLAEAMQSVVDQDTGGRYATRPVLRGQYGTPVAGLEGLLPWEGYPAVLDTFFMVAQRPADPAAQVVGKRGSRFYEHDDRTVHNGFLYFYSVTATDHSLRWRQSTATPSGAGLGGAPGSAFTYATPATPAQTIEERQRVGANIFVYPNPATTRSLAEFQLLHPNADDPTGERVMFANLPRCQNKISIFTEDGDLVQELYHDGSSGQGEIPWNLISRNGQEIVSGIYMFVVQPSDQRFQKFTGRFVVIK